MNDNVDISTTIERYTVFNIRIGGLTVNFAISRIVQPTANIIVIQTTILLAVRGYPRVYDDKICDKRRDSALQYGSVTADYVLGNHFRIVVLVDNLRGKINKII